MTYSSQLDVGQRATTGDVHAPSAKGIARPSSASPPRRMRGILSLDDLERAARRHLSRPLFGYIAGAAENNASRDDNRAAFQELGFLPHVLRDVSRRSQQVELFGQVHAAPFGIAPTGLGALFAYRADIALARAAASANIPMIVSGSSLIKLEDIVKEAPSAWFQAYLPGAPDRILALLDRVEGAGFRTLVLTVDTAVGGNRENNVRAGFSSPLKPSLRLAWDGMIRPKWLLGTGVRTLLRHGMPHFENSYATRGAPIISKHVMRDFGARDHLSWEHLELIRNRWKGRLIVKGVLDPEDARTACSAGVDGIIVSNHGGRQLDGALSPLRALPSIVEAVGGLPVMMDSGIRRGGDVLKSLALGAKFVFLGRSFLYAAVVGEEPGVQHAINILSEEVDRNMALLGINSIKEMGRDRLVQIAGQPGLLR
jgi:L-lactate dehydrogenase (cytochrome)